MSQPRSYLFVPGDRPDRFPKAAASGAHRIILDLEDAVAPGEKSLARQAVAQWFGQGGAGIVRVNGADTPWFDTDLSMLAAYPQAELMLPKAAPGSLAGVLEQSPGHAVVALIETVEGLVHIHAVASAKGVTRLAFGNLDFGADARIPGTGPHLDPARFQIVLASRHAGLPAPIDGVTVSLQDESVLAQDIEHARNCGFAAKLCIHPRQVDRVNAGFAPSPEDIDWAHRIVGAIDESGGAVVQVDGKMVDKPVLDRARAILTDALQ